MRLDLELDEVQDNDLVTEREKQTEALTSGMSECCWKAIYSSDIVCMLFNMLSYKRTSKCAHFIDNTVHVEFEKCLEALPWTGLEPCPGASHGKISAFALACIDAILITLTSRALQRQHVRTLPGVVVIVHWQLTPCG